MAPTAKNGTKLTDDELATLVESKAAAIRSGDRPRAAVVLELLELLAGEPDVEHREYVNVDGRISFGRKHAGESGVAVFAPEGVGDA